MADRFKANLTKSLSFLIAHCGLIAGTAFNGTAQTMPPPVWAAGSSVYFPVSSNDESINGSLPPMTSLKSILEGFEEQPELIEQNKKGARFSERPLLGPSHIKLVDPKNYRRVKALENDDPSSFSYTMRPNLFNVPIDDEWDWLNLINTDRPDFTDTPFSVGAGIAYLENGFTNYRSNGPDAHSTLRTLPESLLRYGITDEFELRLKWTGFQMLSQEDPHTGNSAFSFGGSDLDLGFKYVMWHQRDWVPLSTLVTGALLPTGTNGFSGNTIQPHFNLVQGWGIRRYIYVKHQFGLDHLTQPSFMIDGPIGMTGPFLAPNRSTVNSFHSSISCLYQATKRLGGFVEWYALYGQGQQTTNYFDTGFFFYFTPTVQLDGVVGSSVDAKDTNVLFTKLGFSTRW